jgi:pyrimidine operon attenuation protein/uracil phosphoribosyltransferase
MPTPLANQRLRLYDSDELDDVLFEGHSLLRTCAYPAQLGARRVYTAVLEDRHVCQPPIHADIVVVHRQVATGDIVECNEPPC